MRATKTTDRVPETWDQELAEGLIDMLTVRLGIVLHKANLILDVDDPELERLEALVVATFILQSLPSFKEALDEYESYVWRWFDLRCCRRCMRPWSVHGEAAICVEIRP